MPPGKKSAIAELRERYKSERLEPEKKEKQESLPVKFDMGRLPVPPKKVKLAHGVPKKEGEHSRLANKRHMLSTIAGAKRNLERKISRFHNNPEDIARFRKQNEHENFLKRMLFKFGSLGGGYLPPPHTNTLGDERNTTDFENAAKYSNIWSSLTPLERDQVIAASGRPDYTQPVNLVRYLPKVPSKADVREPNLMFGKPGKDKRAAKEEMISRLSQNKKSLEKEIATPAKYSFEKYYENPGHVPTKEQADELRKNLDRDIFKERQLFRFSRGHDKRFDDPAYNSREFSNLWDSMSPAEKDEYIALETVGMSPMLARKKFGVPSLIDELPEPKKPVVSGPKKTGEGSRAFEKEKVLSDIKGRNEILKKQIQDRKLSVEEATPLIQKNEYDNFLKRQMFKFSDPSHSNILAKKPFNYPSRIFGFNDHDVKAAFKNKWDYDPEEALRILSSSNHPLYSQIHSKFSDIVSELASENAENRKKAYQDYLNTSPPKDPRTREDVEGAEQYRKIWEKLTPVEKNQVMEGAGYHPKGFDYYFLPEPAPVAPLEVKAPMEQQAALFASPLTKEQQLEERNRIKAEKAQRRAWQALSPLEKEQIAINSQVMNSLQAQRQTQYANIARQQGIPLQFEQGRLSQQISPLMLNELMFGNQSQPVRTIPVKQRRSLYDTIMSSFDPNLFSPEFIPEES